MSQSSETNRAVQAWATPEWWTISLFSNVRPFEVLANADRWEIADYRLFAGIIKFGTRHDHRILFLTAGHESHVVGAPSEAYVKTIVQVSRRLIPACEIRELWRTLAALRESARAYSKTRSANGFRGFSAANYCGRGTRRVHDIADATNLLIFMRKGW
jgi:hypothetical protein